MKDLPISITAIRNNSYPINYPCNFINIINSSLNTVEPNLSSVGWGIYGNQQTWADLHLC